MSKNKIIAGVVCVVLMGASFYGGVLYDAHSRTSARGNFSAAQFNRSGSTGGMMNTMGANSRMFGGLAAGEIVSVDASGLTLKMQDGSSKIVLLSASTTILKSTSGTSADLVPGASVTVTGSGNTDGSVTAQSIQIRPAGMQQR